MKEMYQMSGQRFAFSKQRHLFPDSPWFPKIEAGVKWYPLHQGKWSLCHSQCRHCFYIGCLCREKLAFIFFLYLVTFTLSTQTRWMGKQVPGHLACPYSLTRDTESWQGKPEPCRATLETWPRHLVYLLQTWKKCSSRGRTGCSF